MIHFNSYVSSCGDEIEDLQQVIRQNYSHLHRMWYYGVMTANY